MLAQLLEEHIERFQIVWYIQLNIIYQNFYENAKICYDVGFWYFKFVCSGNSAIDMTTATARGAASQLDSV